MGFGWAKTQYSPIGVDFGADSIKLLQILPSDPPQLVAAGSVDMPLEARRDAEAYHRYTASALKEAVRDARFKGRRAVASISSAHTYVRHIRLPRNDEEPMQQQIEQELRGKLPLDPSGLVIRHVEVGEVFADGAAKQEVICLAASRHVVLRQVQTAKAAGLDVVGIHAEPPAILASFGHLYRRAGDEQRTTFFIDIGAATTKAMIAHGRNLVFAKTISVGGDHFDRQMAQRWDVEVSEARMRRCRQASEETPAAAEPQQPGEVEQAPGRDRRRGAGTPPGLASLGAEESAAAQTASGGGEGEATAMEGQTGAPPEAQAATEAQQEPGAELAGDGEMLDVLIDELQLCVGYHASMFEDRPIEKVVFLGGESRHVSMCRKIAQALRLPAQLGDPLARLPRAAGAAPPVNVDLRQPQPGWAVPLGMCLLPTNL